MEELTRDSAISLLRGGTEGIQEWNRRQGSVKDRPDLSGVDLRKAALKGVKLIECRLQNADFREAHLSHAEVCECDFRGADLSRASIPWARLLRVNLDGVNLAGASLVDTRLIGGSVVGTCFDEADISGSNIADLDLTCARGLDRIKHRGRSHVDVSALRASKGRIPPAFLRGCGFAPWEVAWSRLFDPELSIEQINDALYEVHALKTRGPLFLGGVFISYSSDDSDFAIKISDRLEANEATVWLDRHALIAGPLQRQIERAIGLNDIVLLVLSESSICSDWVEKELEDALHKEKYERRDVLCPVALDESWKAKMGDVLWRQVKKKHILDFSKWKTDAFEVQLRKLLTGLKTYYPPKEPPPVVPGSAS